jgi:hypothetical protein
MEPIRPLVDRYLLELLTTRTFAARDFFETRQGVCQVVAPLTHEIGETATEWGKLVGRVAEDVAKALDDSARTRASLPTPISGRRRVAHPGRATRDASRSSVGRTGRACLLCGELLRGPRRTCPGACESAVIADNAVRFGEAGARALQGYRLSCSTAKWTDAARAGLGRAEAERIRQAREWQRAGNWPGVGNWPADLTAFEREILPALASVSAGELARRAGLSVGYCRRIKKGRVVPHPTWWERLGVGPHVG